MAQTLHGNSFLVNKVMTGVQLFQTNYVVILHKSFDVNDSFYDDVLLTHAKEFNFMLFACIFTF